MNRTPTEGSGRRRQEAGGSPPGAGRVALSVVAPVRDEESSLTALYERVRDALTGRLAWELLLVDDGSTDASRDVIRGLCKRDSRVRGVSLARPSGQSSAIFAGIDLARGALVATIDADLQNDPRDLLVLLDALGDADAVVGCRRRRRDGIVKRASSWIANRIRDRVSGDRVADTGCSLKLFRAAALRSLPRFEGMHRFLPTLLRYEGLRVFEIPVSHHPRTAGRSKYGIANRALRGLVDLFAVRWMRSRRLCASFREIGTEEPRM